jgi:hypothetical protein
VRTDDDGHRIDDGNPIDDRDDHSGDDHSGDPPRHA